MPGEVTPCKNVYEAKMYTSALLDIEKSHLSLASLKTLRMFAVRNFLFILLADFLCPLDNCITI